MHCRGGADALPASRCGCSRLAMHTAPRLPAQLPDRFRCLNESSAYTWLSPALLTGLFATGWFHEVTSYATDDCPTHLALNYWCEPCDGHVLKTGALGLEGMAECLHSVKAAVTADWPFSECVCMCTCMCLMHSAHAAHPSARYHPPDNLKNAAAVLEQPYT